MPSLLAVRAAAAARCASTVRGGAIGSGWSLPAQEFSRCQAVSAVWRPVQFHKRCVAGSAAMSSKTTPSTQKSPAELLALLSDLRAAPVVGEAEQARLQAASGPLQGALVEAAVPERIALLQGIADLGCITGRPYSVGLYFRFFFEAYADVLETLRDGETIADRAGELRTVLRCFHRAGIATDRMRIIYSHVESEFPRLESAGALLPMPAAVRLCHTMLATGLSSAPAVTVLLRSALREPLMSIADDAIELRLLKMIELLLRVDFLHTQERLPRDVTEFLAVVRDLRYYDRNLRRETPLSYQLAYFLRKHNFPAKRHMFGPYALKVCDPEERVNFEPVEDRRFRFGMIEEPPIRKQRHLEAVGWRSIPVCGIKWNELETHEAKAAHVRNLLKEHSMISL